MFFSVEVKAPPSPRPLPAPKPALGGEGLVKTSLNAGRLTPIAATNAYEDGGEKKRKKKKKKKRKKERESKDESEVAYDNTRYSDEINI